MGVAANPVAVPATCVAVAAPLVGVTAVGADAFSRFRGSLPRWALVPANAGLAWGETGLALRLGLARQVHGPGSRRARLACVGGRVAGAAQRARVWRVSTVSCCSLM